MKDWVKRNWKRKDGKLANQELWRELYDLSQKHNIQVALG